jgi:hypothetical protein
VVKDGESLARNRRAFAILLNQWGNGAHLAAQYIGGQSISRDHKGDKDARDPIVPVPGAKQRECLAFLVDQILSDKPFQFSPALLRRLGQERWYHWGSDRTSGAVEFPVLEQVLGIQKIALGHCLDSGTLSRLQNQELLADPGSDPLRMAEVFRALTDGIWSDLAPPPVEAKDAKARKLILSTVRRNLQREHLRRLGAMVLGGSRGSAGDLFPFVVFTGGGSPPADARSLARLHLRDISDRIGRALEQKDVPVDDTTRAHLEESRHRIAKVLEAGLDSTEP